MQAERGHTGSWLGQRRSAATIGPEGQRRNNGKTILRDAGGADHLGCRDCWWWLRQQRDRCKGVAGNSGFAVYGGVVNRVDQCYSRTVKRNLRLNLSLSRGATAARARTAHIPRSTRRMYRRTMMNRSLLKIVRRRNRAQPNQKQNQRAQLEAVLRDWMVVAVHEI